MKREFAELIATYSNQSGDLIVAVEGLTGLELDRRLEAGKWSIRQQLNHLADCELNYVHRMKKVIAEDAPLVPAFESDKWAKRLSYDQSSAEDSIALFFTLRASMAPVLRELGDKDFERFGIHTEDGKVTLLSLLERAIEHTNHHMKAIEKIKRKFKIK
jgi:uncharacterized damage-inducible protein DinB